MYRSINSSLCPSIYLSIYGSIYPYCVYVYLEGKILHMYACYMYIYIRLKGVLRFMFAQKCIYGMRIHTCMHVCIHTRIHTYIHTHTCVCVYIYMYTYMHAYILAYLCITVLHYLYVCICICLCGFIHIHIYINIIHIYIYVYVYVYTYAHTYAHRYQYSRRLHPGFTVVYVCLNGARLFSRAACSPLSPPVQVEIGFSKNRALT